MQTQPKKIDARRAADLARIHLAKKELGLEEDVYRSLLRATTGKDSAGAMGPGERWKVLLELGRLGAPSAPAKAYPGKPAIVSIDKAPLLDKIEAQLAEAKRPWAYVHGMAWKMFKKAQIQLCEPDELKKIVAALTYDARRHGR